MASRRLILVAILAALVAAVPPLPRPAKAEQVVWPSEAEERLRQVESELIDVQRQRAVARLYDKQDDLEKVEKKFKKLQEERTQLLRDTRQLR